jgi:hypothetical protein
MSEKNNSKAKPAEKPEPLNEEVMKGLWIDGIGIGLSSDYVVLDGIVAPPRSNKPCVVARLMFAPRMLEHLAKNLAIAAQKQKELKPTEVQVKTEP